MKDPNKKPRPSLKELLDKAREAQKQMEKHSGQVIPKERPKIPGKKSCCFD